MRFVGTCNRCLKEVGGVHDRTSPGLGWADKAGYFAYCEDCLVETKLGWAAWGDRSIPLNKGIYLEDVLKERPHAKQFYLRHARDKWDEREQKMN